MNLLDIFGKLLKRQPKTSRYAATLDGLMPVYGQYGNNIYYSDAVMQALKCIVDEIKKLTPCHVRYVGNDPVPVKGDIHNVLNDPNPLMTASEFLEKTTWLLLLNFNAFIIPVYRTWVDQKSGDEKRYYEALYPIKPNQVDFIEDAGGTLYTKFYFSSGETTTIRYDDVIHLKINFSINQFMGGNELGQPDHQALMQTLDLNRQILKGIAKAMNASYAVNGVVKYNTLLDGEKVQAALEEMEKKLANSENGFLPLDLKAEFIPLERKTEIVDDATLKFLDEKILRNFGVPLAILTGDYTKEQYEAFYQKTIEPLVVNFAQAFTKKMFTPREKSFGNQIVFYPEKLVFMTMTQKISMIELLSPTGALFENEKRTILGLKPLPELEGKRFQSLNWVNADKADEYQVGKNAKFDIVDEEKEDV